MTEYRLVSVLVQHLPASGRWTASYRTRWLRAIVRAVDLLVEIESPTERLPQHEPTVDDTAKEG